LCPANRCTQLAAETNNPQLKEQLLELGKKWGLLALDLEGTIKLLDEWGSKEKPPQK
jgi:hypothetical protein